MKSYSLILIVAVTVLLTIGSGYTQSGSIYISNLYGDYGEGSEGIGDTIATGVKITWILNLNNQTGYKVHALSNGFRVYSPDGATWVPLDTGANGIDEFGNVFEYYVPSGGAWFLYSAPTNVGYGNDGDTIGIGVSDYREIPGFPLGFNSPAIKITIASPGVSGTDGSTLCIDQSGYQVNNDWLWLLSDGDIISPVWGSLPDGYGGPQCYTVYNCCAGARGDANGDGSAFPNIEDLNFVVNYTFRGGEAPHCPTEGDANSDGLPTPNILDLNFLVNYTFRGGPAPGPC